MQFVIKSVKSNHIYLLHKLIVVTEKGEVGLHWYYGLGVLNNTSYSDKKQKDSLETRAVLLISLLELEIFGVTVQRIR